MLFLFILFHPFIEFIRAVLEVVELDFSYESVFRFLRCGLTDITEQQIDLLENYVLAKGIRGRKKWEKQCGRDEEAKKHGIVPIDLDIVIWNDTVLRPKELSRDYFITGYRQIDPCH